MTWVKTFAGAAHCEPGRGRRLVGILSMDDVVEAIAAEIGSVAQALRVEREREQLRELDRAPMTG